MKGAGELHDCILLLLLGGAALSDLRFLRIGNRLLLAGLTAVTLAHLAEPAAPESRSLLAGLLLEAVMLWLFAHRMTGAGDVKLDALILYAKPNKAGLGILVLGTLMGAAYGLWRLTVNGMWRKRYRHLMRYIRQSAQGEPFAYYVRERDGAGPVLPMAVFMLAAAFVITFQVKTGISGG